MLGLDVALVLAVLIALPIGCSLWLRLAELTLADLFLLSIALFFGVYTVIDVILVPIEVETLSVVAVFVLIAWPTLILWSVSRRPPHSFLQTSLRGFWGDMERAAPWAIFALLALTFVYRWYTASFFGGRGEGAIESFAELESDLPYWHTSIGMIANASIFGVTLCAWAKTRAAQSFFRRALWLATTGCAVFFLLGMGRRAILAMLVLIVWDVAIKARARRRFWRPVLIMLLSLPALIVMSNLFQTYRAISYRGVLLENITADVSIESLGDLQALVENAQDVDRTIANLEGRQAIWRFNYELVHAHGAGQGVLQWGNIFLSGLPTHIPAALYPGKVVVETEGVVLDAFGLERYDRPENVFAVAYAEFGWLSIVAVPALLLFFVWLTAKVMARLQDPFLRATLMGMAVYYALNMEAAYLEPLGIARAFILIAVAYLVVRWTMSRAREVVRTAAQDERPAVS